MLNQELSPLQHSVLDGLTERQVEDLDACAEIVHFSPGERILEQGKRADRFFLIQSGRVSVEVYTPETGPRPIQTLGAGDLLGSSWMTPPYKWQFDARAIDAIDAVQFNAHAVETLCAKDPELSSALMKGFMIAVAQRLDASQRQILTLLAGRSYS